MIRDELRDAAVAVVQERAAAALADAEERHVRTEYIEAYQVAHVLQGRGLLTHPDQDSKSWTHKEAAHRSIDGKAKRLLDEAAADGRILRFSSRDVKALPWLDGYPRSLSGNSVGYTTPELYEAAQAAVAAREERERLELEVLTDLLDHADRLGMPKPVKANRTTVTYDVHGLHDIVRLLEPDQA